MESPLKEENEDNCFIKFAVGFECFMSRLANSGSRDAEKLMIV